MSRAIAWEPLRGDYVLVGLGGDMGNSALPDARGGGHLVLRIEVSEIQAFGRDKVWIINHLHAVTAHVTAWCQSEQVRWLFFFRCGLGNDHGQLRRGVDKIGDDFFVFFPLRKRVGE